MGEVYDAVIVGASFAGLAVARQLHGRVLLIDRQEIGDGQTSACGTPLRVLEALGLTRAVHQVHPAFYIHGARRTLRYDLGDRPLCTFDYRSLCEGLARGSEAKFVRATVLGVREGAVLTDQGRFSGRCLVDASGWRAVLASSLRPGYVSRERLSFGLETVTGGSGDALYFWFNPDVVPRGVAWIFPIGGRSRVGIASYGGESRLGVRLSGFLEKLGRTGDGVHGGFFPWQLREPTVGPVFVVGDAAGQCLPVTGEGIRPALHFGAVCGRIVQQVIGGELTLREALSRYRRVVRRHRRGYRALEALQRLILTVPPAWTELAFRMAAAPAFFAPFWAAYAGPPARCAPAWGGQPVCR